MEKLTPYQKKRIWLRLMIPTLTWQSHVDWIKKEFGIEVTDEEVSAFYTQRLTAEPA